MIKLLLADHQTAVRRGLRMWLTLEPDVTVVGEAQSGGEILGLVRALHPDVVVLDVEMPGIDGLALTAALRRLAPRSAVVILSLHDDAATRARAAAAGAAAFVGKHEAADKLLAAIRRVAEKLSA